MGERRTSERRGDNTEGGGAGVVDGVDDSAADGGESGSDEGGGSDGGSGDGGVGAVEGRVVSVAAAPSASMRAIPSAATVCVRALLRYAKWHRATSIISGSISHTHRRNAGR